MLASARKDLQAQLAVVREEMSRLAADEHALTQALASLERDTASSSTAPASEARAHAPTPKRSARGTSSRKGASRRRRAAGTSKSTADRVEELRVLLADGPKSKNDLAAALEVSPPRVQQLLAELGSSVSSQPDPAQRQGKLWRLKGADGTSPAKPAEAQ